MKKLLIIAILACPWTVSADYMDVIAIHLKEGCTVEDLVPVKDDFNETWGSKNGYMAEWAVPLYSDDMETIYWIGRTESAQAYGAAWDTWRDNVGTEGSVEAGLWERFLECEEVPFEHRRGYDIR